MFKDMFKELMSKKAVKKRIHKNRKTLIMGLVAIGVAFVIGILCLCIALLMNSKASKAAAKAAETPVPTSTPVVTTAPMDDSDPEASTNMDNADADGNTTTDGTAADNTAEATPEPTATPAPTTAVGPTVTKMPYSEKVTAGGTVVFVAHAKNYKSVEWRIVSEDTKTSYDLETASKKFGFWYTGAGTDTITIGDVLLPLDGWQVQACFTDKNGNSAYTDFAQLQVVKATQW